VTQDKVNAVVFTKIGNPVPGEQALHDDDQAIEIGLDQFHQSLRTGLDILVCNDLPIVFDRADIEVLGGYVQISPRDPSEGNADARSTTLQLSACLRIIVTILGNQASNHG
jgi:hypothetical protein